MRPPPPGAQGLRIVFPGQVFETLFPWTITRLRIIEQGVGERRMQTRMRTGLAGTPVAIQAFVPGLVRQQLQCRKRAVVRCIDVDCIYAIRGRRGRRDDQCPLQRPPERREHPVGAAVAFRQLPGFDQQAGIETVRDDAGVDQLRFELAVMRYRVRFVATIPEHFIDGVALPEAGQDGCRVALLKDQFRAEAAQPLLQLGETLVQPPAAGGSRRPVSVSRRPLDEHRQNAIAPGDCMLQRRVVGKPQIAAEPEDDIAHRGRGSCCIREPPNIHLPSFPRRRESRDSRRWIPACAGMTGCSPSPPRG